MSYFKTPSILLFAGLAACVGSPSSNEQPTVFAPQSQGSSGTTGDAVFLAPPHLPTVIVAGTGGTGQANSTDGSSTGGQGTGGDTTGGTSTGGGTTGTTTGGIDTINASIQTEAVTIRDAIFAPGTIQGHTFIMILVADEANFCDHLTTQQGSVPSFVMVQLQKLSNAAVTPGTYTVYDPNVPLPAGAQNNAAILDFVPKNQDQLDDANTGTVRLTKLTTTSLTISVSARAADTSHLAGTVTATYCAAFEASLRGK